MQKKTYFFRDDVITHTILSSQLVKVKVKVKVTLLSPEGNYLYSQQKKHKAQHATLPQGIKHTVPKNT